MEETARRTQSPSGATTFPSCFRRIHAHVPFPFLKRKLHFFLERALNPEIYFSYRALEKIPEKDYADLAAILEESGLKATIHGPFYDLSPGALDPGFRALTLQRMTLALERASLFSPECVVFHPGYDPLRFGEHRHVWLKNSLQTWKELIPQGKKMPSTWFLLENIFENDPFSLAELLSRLPSPPFGFCFDTGHFQVFSDVALDEWIGALGPYLREVHLHDNAGTADDHLPPGRGTFDFEALFGLLSHLPEKIIGTVEAHSEDDLLESLDCLRDHGRRS